VKKSDLDPNEIEDAWMVGDRLEDEQCAINAGINFCPAEVWRDRFKD
jgi:D-glycero-D-manno-heptose 1,7-bisphosphate phosphatase